MQRQEAVIVAGKSLQVWQPFSFITVHKRGHMIDVTIENYRSDFPMVRKKKIFSSVPSSLVILMFQW